MIAPDVACIRRETWLGSGGHTILPDLPARRVLERFLISGGTIAPDWAASLRPPRAPWCEITIWNEGTHVSGYGGEVWPLAWPEMFEQQGPKGRERIMLTDAGIAALNRSRERHLIDDKAVG